MSRLGGGIGTRGPGETKLEVDRRRIELRVSKIKDRIRDLQKRRSGQRASRRKSLIPMVALVGYTSVGKSTLFNRLAKETTLDFAPALRHPGPPGPAGPFPRRRRPTS